MNKETSQDKNIHKHHRIRMREKFTRAGFDSFTDVEKLEFILFFSIAQKNTNPIAHRLLQKFGSFDAVLEAPINRLQEVDGIGEQSAFFLNSLLQIANAYGKSKNVNIISGTESAKSFAKNLLSHKTVEEFYIICLAPNNKVLSYKLIGTGTTSSVQIQIRELTKAALECNCERIIIAHNHPQGKALPSDEDIAFTNKVIFSCFTNNIDVLDHIIISQDDEFSFVESKLLKSIKDNAIRNLHINGLLKTKLQQSADAYKNDNE